jgi:hypothetical protein
MRDKMTRESLMMESARAEVASDRDALNLRLSESERCARRLESERETWQAERKQLCDDASERERTLAEVTLNLLSTGAAIPWRLHLCFYLASTQSRRKLHDVEQASAMTRREREEVERQLHNVQEDRDWFVLFTRRHRLVAFTLLGAIYQVQRTA